MAERPAKKKGDAYNAVAAKKTSGEKKERSEGQVGKEMENPREGVGQGQI